MYVVRTVKGSRAARFSRGRGGLRVHGGMGPDRCRGRWTVLAAQLWRVARRGCAGVQGCGWLAWAWAWVPCRVRGVVTGVWSLRRRARAAQSSAQRPQATRAPGIGEGHEMAVMCNSVRVQIQITISNLKFSSEKCKIRHARRPRADRSRIHGGADAC